MRSLSKESCNLPLASGGIADGGEPIEGVCCSNEGIVGVEALCLAGGVVPVLQHLVKDRLADEGGHTTAG